MAEKKIDWDKLSCRETKDYNPPPIDDYVYCGQPAVEIVLHYKDQKAYPMCFLCANHNTHNRGGVSIAKKE